MAVRGGGGAGGGRAAWWVGAGSAPLCLRHLPRKRGEKILGERRLAKGKLGAEGWLGCGHRLVVISYDVGGGPDGDV